MISEELRVLDDKLHKVSDNITAAYNKITEKGGTPTGTTSLELAESIDTIPEGSGGVCEPTDDDYVNNVIFWDYDAEVVGIYSIPEVLSWTDYSAVTNKLKHHNGLVFIQWNLDLPTLQNYLVTYQHPFDVGAMYEAEDGKAHFTINLVQDNDYWSFATNGDATVDWGDGTVETLTGSNVKSHNYQLKGVYDITIETTATGFGFGTGQGRKCIGTALFPKTMVSPYMPTGAESVGCYAENMIFPLVYNNNSQNYFGTAYFAKIYITANTQQRLPNQWFNCKVLCGNTWHIYQTNTGTNLYNLKRFAVIAAGNTTVYTNYLASTQNIVAVYCDNFIQTSSGSMSFGVTNTIVSLPPKITFANNTAKYSYCYKLEHIIDFYERIGKFTNLNNIMFHSCGRLKTPLKFDNVTSIAINCFAQCVAIPEIDFSGQTTVPTLAAVTAFTNCKAKFLIPDALYDTWVTATNWATMYTLAPNRFVRV